MKRLLWALQCQDEEWFASDSSDKVHSSKSENKFVILLSAFSAELAFGAPRYRLNHIDTSSSIKRKYSDFQILRCCLTRICYDLFRNSSCTLCSASGCILFLLGMENVVKKFILVKTLLPVAMAFYAFNLYFFWERQISDCIGIAEFFEKNFSDLFDQIFIRH